MRSRRGLQDFASVPESELPSEEFPKIHPSLDSYAFPKDILTSDHLKKCWLHLYNVTLWNKQIKIWY